MPIPVSSATSAAAATAAPAAASKKNTLDYNNFLKLLIAQMTHQDPTEPMKSTEYMGQLASFSQVEQSVNMNSKLDALLSSSALSQADAAIGRTITSADRTISGKVVSVALVDGGAQATLDNGQTLGLGNGITVS